MVGVRECDVPNRCYSIFSSPVQSVMRYPMSYGDPKVWRKNTPCVTRTRKGAFHYLRSTFIYGTMGCLQLRCMVIPSLPAFQSMGFLQRIMPFFENFRQSYLGEPTLGECCQPDALIGHQLSDYTWTNGSSHLAGEPGSQREAIL